MWEYLNKLDRDLFIYLNGLGVDQYDEFWVFVTQIEHWTPLYLLFFVLYFKIYDRKAAISGVVLTILTFLTTLLFTEFTKNVVARLRPNNVIELEGLIRVLQTPTNFSFFSGHAAVSFAVTTFVVCAMRSTYKWVYLFYIWPLLFIMSRVFVGVHYPSDLAVGTVVGIGIGISFWRLLGKKYVKSPKRK